MGSEDEWDESEDGVVVCECDQCGEEKPCIYSEDPFIAEVYPEDENGYSHWCRACFVSRKDDI